MRSTIREKQSSFVRRSSRVSNAAFVSSTPSPDAAAALTFLSIASPIPSDDGSPQWISGGDVIFKTPKVPSPARTRRRTTMVNFEPMAGRGFKSPPGVKTRSRRASVYTAPERKDVGGVGKKTNRKDGGLTRTKVELSGALLKNTDSQIFQSRGNNKVSTKRPSTGAKDKLTMQRGKKRPSGILENSVPEHIVVIHTPAPGKAFVSPVKSQGAIATLEEQSTPARLSRNSVKRSRKSVTPVEDTKTQGAAVNLEGQSTPVKLSRNSVKRSRKSVTPVEDTKAAFTEVTPRVLVELIKQDIPVAKSTPQTPKTAKTPSKGMILQATEKAVTTSTHLTPKVLKTPASRRSKQLQGFASAKIEVQSSGTLVKVDRGNGNVSDENSSPGKKAVREKSAAPNTAGRNYLTPRNTRNASCGKYLLESQEQIWQSETVQVAESAASTKDSMLMQSSIEENASHLDSSVLSGDKTLQLDTTLSYTSFSQRCTIL